MFVVQNLTSLCIESLLFYHIKWFQLKSNTLHIHNMLKTNLINLQYTQDEYSVYHGLTPPCFVFRVYY